MARPFKLPAPNERQLARFLAKVPVGDPDACWLWTASVDKDGYGQFGIRAGLMLKAHQCSFEWIGKRQIVNALSVLHSCDTPPCCNPAHLYLGTHRRNMQDVVARRRQQGERNGNAHLTEARAVSIFALREQGLTLDQIGARVGVGPVEVFRILRGERWGHLLPVGAAHV